MLAGVLCALTTSGCQSAATRSALLSELGPQPYEAQSEEMMRRLGERHWIGGPESGLETYLQGQHMKTRRAHVEVRNAVIYGEAVAYATVFRDCSTVYFVHWRADASGKLTELNATAGDSGCF